MQEQEENIHFDNMPNFGDMFSAKANDWDDEKEYNSLYDELLDKCRPDRFIGDNGDTNDNKKFLLANQLYAELKSKHRCRDEELIEFRDKAMDLLGINISTKKLYEWMERYLNPKIYTTMEPYDAERVALSGEYYLRMLECRNDIHALEKLRDEVQAFIDRKLNEEKKAQSVQEQIEKQKIAEHEDSMVALTVFGFIALLVTLMIIATL